MLAEILRYSAAGVINTIVGYAIIFGGMAAGFSPYASNFAGYMFGLACSFYLNKYFVFSVSGGGKLQAVRFLLAFIASYIANFSTLYLCLQAGVSGVLSQIVAGVVYLFAMFVLSRAWVFQS